MLNISSYKARRIALAKMLAKNSIAIIPSASLVLRNGDSHYKFRQDSDFLYLTGFEEPNAILVIFSGDSDKSYLFNQVKEPLKETWTGTILGQDAALKTLGVSAAYPVDKFSLLLPEFLEDINTIFYPIAKDPKIAAIVFSAWQKVKNFTRRGIGAPYNYTDLAPFIAELRLFKSGEEIKLLQQAANISVQAHKKAMQQCKHKNYEYEVQAELLYGFLQGGCSSEAYSSIVAAGKNACVLHYTQNTAALNKGELLLIDAGGEYKGYAADITRTFPINGKFSAEQRALYELVLHAQKAAIACLKPGTPWEKLQQVIVRTLTSGLVDLGLLKGSVDNLIESKAYAEFYMHQSGHWLGLDVHDSGSYRQNNKSRSLQEGMVLTIEPGLYISSSKVDKRWQGIGIRIEDDFLITKDGYHEFTKELVKEVTELEDFLRE